MTSSSNKQEQQQQDSQSQSLNLSKLSPISNNYMLQPATPQRIERSVSPLSAPPMTASTSTGSTKNVQFSETVLQYNNESAIVTSDEDNDGQLDNVAEDAANFANFKSNFMNYKLTPSASIDGSTNSNNRSINYSLSSLESMFNSRPLSDTPIMSAYASPSALSPMNLSEDEDENEEEYDERGGGGQGHPYSLKHADRVMLDKQTESNTHLNKIIPSVSVEEEPGSPKIPLPKYKTTLDIPGQTASKQSPDGFVVNRSERVVVVMIGLPARGKSFLANKLVRYLNWLQIKARIFNVGATRRAKSANIGPEKSPLPDASSKGNSPADTRSTTPDNEKEKHEENILTPTAISSAVNTAVASTDTSKTATPVQDANFFSPDNKSSIALREEWAKETLENLLDYLLDGDGCVGVFDATNTTIARRKMVLDTIRKRSKGQLKVLFLESICNDANLIDDNVHLKLQGPDYKKMDSDLALKDFYGRLRNYEKKDDHL
ncbi:unnamed protein product [Ambrosiozyma monospora]|uniref:Unnamed protein product n=1 Tax=Ambrosiozyma monospora TaxID=43982 RepID=A0A9W7DFT9_AMBMO|nr:unnamed protein product [Ambrosiozyma monospora]